MKKTSLLIGLGVGAALLLGACGEAKEKTDASSTEASSSTTVASSSSEGTEKSTASGESTESASDASVIDSMVESTDPKFPVGSEVILKADHMEGMKDAEATVTGAYETTLYEVTYESTTTGEKVENHKWVVQEELDTDQTDLKKGDKVKLKADHMDGMKDAEATIEDAVTETAYMVDYTPTNGDADVKDHKWVTADELEEA